jgi:hypothetical protein
MQFDKEALSRMANEGGPNLTTPRTDDAIEDASLTAPTRDSMPWADSEYTAEMFTVYARLSGRWNERAAQALTSADVALPAAA